MEHKENIKKTTDFCIEKGYFESLPEGVKLTDSGKKVLSKKIERLYEAMKNIGKLPKGAPEETTMKLFAENLLKSFDNNPGAVLVKILSDIEPIGYENWLKFELLDTSKLLPN